MSEFNDSDWKNYSSGNTNNCLQNTDISAILFEHDTTMWIGSGWGVIKYNGSNWKSYTVADGLAEYSVYSVAIDAHGNKWFGTYKGLSKFDGSTWKTYSTSDGLPGNVINSIVIDSLDNLWIATWYGVARFDRTNWVTYTSKDGLANDQVYVIKVDNQGNKWFGTSGGVSKYNDSEWTTYTTIDGLVDNDVKAIAFDFQNNIWFGTANGVSRFNEDSWKTYTTADGLASNNINDIAIDAQGNKWFATADSGVSELSYRMNISETSFDVEAGPSTRSIDVSSDVNWNVTVSEPWLTVDPDVGSNNGTLTISVTNNPETTPRIAIIIINGNDVFPKTITVTQQGQHINSLKDDMYSDIFLYPNPVNNKLFIHLSQENLPAKISLWSANGCLIYTTEAQTTVLEIDLTGYSAGIYNLKIQSPGKITHNKLLKE